MNQWFMSYKIYFDNNGIYESFDFYNASASKSGSDVALECAKKIAQEHNVAVEQILFISFNKV
ncbi:hypothetical protein [Serratia marcescens]